ncbi:MAG: arsenate reductase ArsC [Sphingomonadales bacterium]|jgi:protein-tyrosine-phosphatase
MDPNRIPRLPRSVLFTCNENAVRSPMAEGLARAYFKRRIFVASAGIVAGQLDSFSIEVMRESGIDISHHQPKTFDDVAEEDFALIISLTPEAQHHAVELTRTSDAVVEYWPTFDPTIVEGSRQTRLNAYGEVRDALRKRIIERFNF